MKNTNYKYIYIKTVLVTTFMFIFSVLYTTAATVKYVPLEAGAFKDFGSTDSLVGLLTSVFNFGIAIAVVSALIMIIWGGIIKMTTDSWQGQDDAKNKFENAGYGLGLALVSYVILYTINPCLVLFGEKSKCNNQLLFAPVATSSNIDGADSATVAANTKHSGILSGVSVWSSGGCFNENKTGCTDLKSLPFSAIKGINDLATKAGVKNITITGGAETAGHNTHGPNIANVDVDFNMETFNALRMTPFMIESNYTGRPSFTCEPDGGGHTSVPCNSPDAGVIHIQFK